MASPNLKCGFCKEKFDENERCPRVLNCSHTVCHHCTSNLIKRDIKVCPFCREEFEAQSPSKVHTDKGILDLLRSSSKKRSLESVQTPQPLPPSKRPKKGRSSHVAATCSEVQKHIEGVMQKICSLQTDLVQENEVIRDKVLPEINNIISHNDGTLDELMDINEVLEENCEVIVAKLQQLDTDDNAGITGKEIQDIKKNAFEKDALVESLEKEVKKAKGKTLLVLEVLGQKQNEQEESSSASSTSTINSKDRNIAGYLKVETLLEMNSMVIGLIHDGRIYAVHGQGTERRYAQLSMLEDHLCLRHLKQEQPMETIFILELTKILEGISLAPKLAFLQLRSIHSQKLLGTLMIRLTQNSKRSENFWLMCTGELGPSYANTRIMEVCGKGEDVEHICLGDYEGKNGYGGKALVPDAGNESGEILKKPWSAGIVTGEDCYGGDDTASQFKIFTRSRSNATLDLSFGIVENGLKVITNAIARYPKIEDVYIGDCGVVVKSF